MRTSPVVLSAAAGLVLAGSLGWSAEPAPATVLSGLENPSGIVVHAESGQVFFAERRGVFRIARGDGGQAVAKPEISEYRTDIYGKGPMYDIGPLGLAFLDAEHLVVGDGSRVDGEELVRVYKVGAQPPANPQPETAAVFTLGPITAGTDSAKGEGNYYGVAVTAGAIFATANGDDTKGWVARSVVENGKPGPLHGFIATKPKLEVDAPVAITVGPEGALVISQMGEVNVAGDSLLTFYDAKTGELQAKHTTGLHDIAGLAFSPDSGKLYAVDFAWVDTKQGGLFELTISGETCEARKVASLDKPTALAFEKNGDLLVTVFGSAKEGDTAKPGSIVRFKKSDL